MSTINPSIKLSVGKWLEENEPKLRQYARALAARDAGEFFDEGDFFNAMSMKIYAQAIATNKFMEMPIAYLFKVVWNEGLMMIRKQRCYNMHIQSVSESEDGDVLEAIPSQGCDPEEILTTRHQSELIASAIDSLPEKSRRVCEMLYAGERPADIARKLGLRSRSTINYHIAKIQETFLQFGLQPA